MFLLWWIMSSTDRIIWAMTSTTSSRILKFFSKPIKTFLTFHTLVQFNVWVFPFSFTKNLWIKEPIFFGGQGWQIWTFFLIMSHLPTLVTLNYDMSLSMFLLLLIFSYNTLRFNWFIWFIIYSMVDSMREFTSKCFRCFGSVENWIAFAMDYIVSHGTSFMYSSFFLSTFGASSNIFACSYFTYYCFDNKLMLKYSNTMHWF